MSFFDELVKRFTLPSPSFFVKVQQIGVSLIGLGGVMLLTNIQLPAEVHIVIPPIVSKIGGYLILAGSVMKAVGKLTVSDPTQLDPTKPQ